MILLAVHLADVMTGPWVIGGWLGALALVAWALRNLADEEIPRVGIAAAVFFVASQFHLPLGAASAHPVLNGLIGITLRRRAPIAIGVGLGLQTLLFGHGGKSTLGLNLCFIALPALVVGELYPWVHPWFRSRLFRFGSVAGIAFLWLSGAAIAIEWTTCRLRGTPFPEMRELAFVQPLVGGTILLVSGVMAFLEPRMESDPEFPLGLFLGASALLATLTLDALALYFGGDDSVRSAAGALFLVHIPIVLAEGLVVGFAVRRIARTTRS